MTDRYYCTLAELIDDLRLPGNEAGLLARIEQASAFIDQQIGNFIPVTATNTYEGINSQNLDIDPLTALTSLVFDGQSLTNDSDFFLEPRNKRWLNGCYTRIKKYSGAWGGHLQDIDIAGRWGLYEETVALGVSGTQATTSTTSLVVTDGSKLSPGMVLLLDTEQELITDFGSVSSASSLLNGAIDTSDEDVTVDNGAEFYVGEVIKVNTEDMYIRRIAGNILTVGRGWNNTVIASHVDDSAISVYRTFTVRRGINGTTAATHTSAAISRYVAPSDVNWLCRQIAGLMRMKAASGFAGKTGNVEMGEVFYHNEFPNDPIKKIKNNYRIVRL